MKRTRWLIALLAVTTLFCACQKDGNTPSDTTAATTPAETTAPAPTDIDLVKDGEAKYVIVRPETSTPAEMDAAIAISTAIEMQTGVIPILTTDWIKRGQEYDSSTFEILVGSCAQPEVLEVLQSVGYGQYIVKPAGNKLVIAAWGDQGFTEAASLFQAAITEHGTAGALTLPADFVLTGTVNQTVDLLPVYPGGMVEGIIDCADDNQMVYITDTTADAFKAYCDTVAKSGSYTLYTEREAAGNLFATYTSETHNIHTYFNAAEGETRIIIEPSSALPPRAEDTTTANDKYEPAVCLVGLEYNYSGNEYSQIGLMMLFRLPDGRLIVVDGGSNKAKAAELLWQNMRELAPDKNNITIAAWVLTHAHGDHSGGFLNFADSYGSKVKVERVIHNFTTVEQYASIQDYGHHQKARDAAEKLADEVIKAHNGQLYHFGGATMEILYTFDDFLPDQMAWGNSTSLVCRISMGGQTVMVLGDVTTSANNILCKMYGNYLKSDIVQVTHHGSSGGTVQVYNLIDADTALWPGGERSYEGRSRSDENAFLLKNVRDVYVAADDVYTLILPYIPVGNNPKYAG